MFGLKNLTEILVRDKLSYSPQEKTCGRCWSETNSATHHRKKLNTNPDVTHTSSCTTSKCRCFPLLNKSGRITSTCTGRSYSAKIRVDCKSNNLIYCLTCKHCQIQYADQTKMHHGSFPRSPLQHYIQEHQRYY